MPAKYKAAKCVVVGDSVVRNVGADLAEIMVKGFPRIKTDQLHKMMGKKLTWVALKPL